jgi:hypothetical protein
MSGRDVTSTSSLLEGALLAHVELGAHWAIAGGPVVQALQTPPAGEGGASVMLFVGLQHR